MFTQKYKKNKSKIISIIAILLLVISLVVINSHAANNPQPQWIRIYDTYKTDKAFAVTTDSYNNIIVTGVSRITDDKSYTIKYNTDGTKILDITADTPFESKTYDVAVDSQDNIILAGGVYNAQGNYDYYIAKYSSNGNELWTQSYDSGFKDMAYGIAVDSNDNIIVTGEAANKYYTIKFDNSGTELWSKTYNTFQENCARSVAVDENDNIIVTGYVYTGTTRDWYTIKYNSNGQELWSKTFSNGNFNRPNGVTTCPDNSIIVVGTVYWGTDSDIYIIKYDETGMELWSRSYDYSIGDTATDVATNAVNDIIVSGSAYETGQSKNYALIKYDSNGNYVWSTFFDRYYGDDYGFGVAVDTLNNIIITGFSRHDHNPYDYLTIKYKDTITQDTQNPVISNVNDQPDPQQSGGYVNISCEATDNIGISSVKAYITDPDGFSYNAPMISNGIYYLNTTYTIVGTYNYYIKAFDTSNNQITSATYSFTITALPDNPPYQPDNPSPPNGATSIDINVALSWTGGDPDPEDTVTYDVYFGTSTTPSKVVGNQSETMYQPWVMNLNTTYYWQIIAWDNHGVSTQGPIWIFTTTLTPNIPPNTPEIPDGQTLGHINVLYDYSTSTIDVDGDNVSYGWDWDGDLVVDEWSAWYNSGETCTMSHSWDEPGIYDVQVKARDVHLAENKTWSNILSVTIGNNAPNEPINPSPSNGATDVNINPLISANVSDPDGNSLTVLFYNAFDDSLINSVIVPNGSIASVTWSDLSYNTTYNWYVIVNDSLLENISDTWSFKTIIDNGQAGGGDPPPNGDGGDTPTGSESSNAIPTADTNGPYYGFPDIELEFDGSNSYDNDENGESIKQYDWKFFDGDDWHNDLGPKPKYTYTEGGEFTVTLRVHDDESSTATDTTTAIIQGLNNPPSEPIVSGTTSGEKNTNYVYTALSTDPDDDKIRYIFDWDDITLDTITDYEANNTPADAAHLWLSAGAYNVKVFAEDEHNATSGTVELMVTIDVNIKYIEGDGVSGYLIDYGKDGTYETFYNNKTGNESIVEKQESGTYLLDCDEDGQWDHEYDPETDTLTKYPKDEEKQPAEEGTNYIKWYLLGFLLLIITLFIFYFAAKKKKMHEKTKK